MPTKAKKTKTIKSKVAAKKVSKSTKATPAASKKKVAISTRAKTKKPVTKKPARTTTTKLTKAAKPSKVTVSKVKSAAKTTKTKSSSVKAGKPTKTAAKAASVKKKPASAGKGGQAKEVKTAHMPKAKGENKASKPKKDTKQHTKSESTLKESTRKEKITMTAEIAEVTPKTQETVISTTMGFLGIPPYAEKADEEYMNAHQQGHFRKLLERWKQELMQEVDRTMHHMKDDAGNYPDLSDRASQEEEFNLELRARDRERKLIWKIDEALERIEKDDYGYCDACGVEIGIRRLEARPTATLCIDCKTLDEIREKQTRA